MTVALPADDEGVFSAIGYAFDAPADERTVHVDRYGGQVVVDVRLRRLPGAGQGGRPGHRAARGPRLGLVDSGDHAFCLAMIFMCVTGPLMWWRRRPKGRLLGHPAAGCRCARPRCYGRSGRARDLPAPFRHHLVVVLLLDQLVVLRKVPALALVSVSTVEP